MSEELDEINELEKALAGDTEEAKKVDSAVKGANLGGETVFKGLKLRPVTLSTLAILEKLNSPLVTGEPNTNNVLEALIFIWVQSTDRKQVTAATLTSDLDSRINIEAEALSLGDRLSITDMQELVEVVTNMMSESQLTKVEAIPDDSNKHAKKSKNK
tara:strand:- start:1120 stop:1593 length:474 start_codon:yes stop_codon:yes gene_type:complete